MKTNQIRVFTMNSILTAMMKNWSDEERRAYANSKIEIFKSLDNRARELGQSFLLFIKYTQRRKILNCERGSRSLGGFLRHVRDV